MNHEEHGEREGNGGNTDYRVRPWARHFVIFVSFVVNPFRANPLTCYAIFFFVFSLRLCRIPASQHFDFATPRQWADRASCHCHHWVAPIKLGWLSERTVSHDLCVLCQVFTASLPVVRSVGNAY